MLVTNLANSSLILASASVLAQIPKSTDGQHSTLMGYPEV